MPIPWGIFGVTKERKERFKEDLRRAKAGLPLTDTGNGDTKFSPEEENLIIKVRSYPLKEPMRDIDNYDDELSEEIRYSFTLYFARLKDHRVNDVETFFIHLLKHSSFSLNEKQAKEVYQKYILLHYGDIEYWIDYFLRSQDNVRRIKEDISSLKPGSIERNVVEIMMRNPKRYEEIFKEYLPHIEEIKSKM